MVVSVVVSWSVVISSGDSSTFISAVATRFFCDVVEGESGTYVFYEPYAGFAMSRNATKV